MSSTDITHTLKQQNIQDYNNNNYSNNNLEKTKQNTVDIMLLANTMSLELSAAFDTFDLYILF